MLPRRIYYYAFFLLKELHATFWPEVAFMKINGNQVIHSILNPNPLLFLHVSAKLKALTGSSWLYICEQPSHNCMGKLRDTVPVLLLLLLFLVTGKQGAVWELGS